MNELSLDDPRYNLVFWAKRLLNEDDNGSASDCGDHCRNTCRWCGLRNAVQEATVAAVNALPVLLRERESLREALTALLGWLESGDLVRNTKWEGEADWAIKQIPLLRDLAKAHEVLAGGGGE